MMSPTHQRRDMTRFDRKEKKKRSKTPTCTDRISTDTRSNLQRFSKETVPIDRVTNGGGELKGR